MQHPISIDRVLAETMMWAGRGRRRVVVLGVVTAWVGAGDGAGAFGATSIVALVMKTTGC